MKKIEAKVAMLDVKKETNYVGNASQRVSTPRAPLASRYIYV